MRTKLWRWLCRLWEPMYRCPLCQESFYMEEMEVADGAICWDCAVRIREEEEEAAARDA